MRRLVTTAMALALAVALCASQRPAPDPLRVLFVGNSYTYYNNLPEIFRALAASRGRTVDVRMAAPGGWRLKDHWDRGDAPRVLRNGTWHYVVLQDQSTLGVNYFVEGTPHVSTDEVFRPHAERWVTTIRDAGATPVFYLTWARRATPEDQAALNAAYIRTAQATRAAIAPAGIAWARVRARHPDIDLFQKDGSHPSPAGSYLTACALFATIFDEDPAGLPGRITGPSVNLDTGQVEPTKTAVLVDLPANRARLLQRAAWAAWREIGKARGYPKVAPVKLPGVSPVPEGERLSDLNLSGRWQGTLRFYPGMPVVEMSLELRADPAAWKGRLDIKYGSQHFQDESLDVADLVVGERTITFSQPQSVGVDKLRVDYRGAMTRPGELRGTASAVRETPDMSPVRVLGTWTLTRRSSSIEK
jgi:hypothetical protein